MYMDNPLQACLQCAEVTFIELTKKDDKDCSETDPLDQNAYPIFMMKTSTSTLSSSYVLHYTITLYPNCC